PTLRDSLFCLNWPALPGDTFPQAAVSPTWIVVAADPHHLPPGLHQAPIHPDLNHPDLNDTDLVIWALPISEESEHDALPRIHTLTQHVLTQLQHWLTRPDTLHTPLVILTCHAIATSIHDRAPNLAHAAAWALIHTTQNEHPGRINLIDTDPAADERLLINVLAALGHTPTEPQLALRHGTAHIPRLTRTTTLTPPPTPTWDLEGTVLITGGSGALAGVFAEHLVTKHGIRHLLLVSRRGPDAPGATEFHQRLTDLGAHVTFTACDTSNPTELATLLQSIPTQHRLIAVIHAAGILADAVITELTETQLDTVLAAKADTAWHLHQLTATQDLAAFVVFSSAAATLGNPGQANYAAANAVLDALAHQRHRQQLPATSLAWGYWQTPSGMTAHLSQLDQARIGRASLTPISTEHGLALFDAALTHQQPALVLAPLNLRALDRLGRTNTLPPILAAP
ncbi:beta-ketoacyl reductase, partial [Mycobacterium simulans]|uniref:beta-ketoacyl reductase n=1 Tax=Mycobacterium simulans TaxID=627089 RepID=UPI00174C4AD9